ncbi:hypothetical protein QUA62_01625 [Microcoleus sp. MON1_C1]|uniref:hypothetical protein n=1 Tax=Microcoleus sp. MON1_C1 TaxID=2818827 RepID=UPI002FCE962D
MWQGSTAEAMHQGYMQILRRLLPAAQQAIVFDTTGAEKLPEVRSAELERIL